MSACTIRFTGDSPAVGSGFLLVPEGTQPPAAKHVRCSPFPRLRAGEALRAGPFLAQAQSFVWLPGQSGSVPAWLMETWSAAPAGTREALIERSGWSLAWITLSDKGAAGQREDESGPLVAELVREKMDISLVRGFVLPDDEARLKGLLADLTLQQGVDLVVTTGGTGLSPRDVTPEATGALLEKRLHGFERAMTAASLAKTPYGAGSRALAGTVGKSIVVNLPGSPKAVRETLEPLLPVLGHSLDKLHGDPSDCASLHC